MRRMNSENSPRRARSRVKRLPLASAICWALSATSIAGAADGTGAADAAATVSASVAADTSAADQAGGGGKGDTQPTLETVTVTAEKRTEDVQKVPISITVLGTQDLEEQYVSDFKDYAKLLPNVSFTTFGPGFSQVYMRGVANGSNGNHSGPLPSVGVYLDEEPITTITGALDLHIYDIERVEALAGPQGTLYGASSQAGTIRIITNKPDPKGFAAGYTVQGDYVHNGSAGGLAEGYVNVPIAEHVAFRASVWDRHDGGYIDNVFGTRTYPTSGITENNANTAKDNYNDVDTTGARAALKVDFFDNWTVTPTVMTQRQNTHGIFAFDPNVGDLQVVHPYPEKSNDEWTQAALTINGKIGNFDVVYAGSHLKRDVDTESDYSDYSFWYDTLSGYGAYFYDDAGNLINPAQYIIGKDRYTKRSHELRISSPVDYRARFVAGTFWQQQSHNIQQRYKVNGLASSLEVTGWPDTIWLTKQVRQDHDEAVFLDGSFDITPKLTLTAGVRYFRVDNSLKGFFGFGTGYSSTTGEAACIPGSSTFQGAPCVNLDKETKESNHLGRVNLTYQIDDDKMVYVTRSEGYRPGGINRRGTLAPYVSDFLTNYEFGWKLVLLDHRLAFNGAIFHDEWKDFQFAILGANGLTEIKNANQARINGAELQANFAATYNLRLSGGVAFYDAKLSENYCGFTDSQGRPVTVCDTPQAPNGTRLPITAKFKGNITARYEFTLASYDAFWQAVFAHEGSRTSDLRLIERDLLGDLPSYSLLDLSAGIKKDSWAIEAFVKNVTDERAELNRYAECATQVCGNQPYVVPSLPRTFGVRFSQKF